MPPHHDFLNFLKDEPAYGLQTNICPKLIQFTNHQAISHVPLMWNSAPSTKFQQNQETNRTPFTQGLCERYRL